MRVKYQYLARMMRLAQAQAQAQAESTARRMTNAPAAATMASEARAPWHIAGPTNSRVEMPRVDPDAA
jgi:hypothetical protein